VVEHAKEFTERHDVTQPYVFTPIPIAFGTIAHYGRESDSTTGIERSCAQVDAGK